MLAVMAPSVAGAAGLATNSKTVVIIAVLSWLLALIAVTGELLLQKRRDDVLAITVRERGEKAARPIIIHEAVRSGQLMSGDIVKLLAQPGPDPAAIPPPEAPLIRPSASRQRHCPRRGGAGHGSG
jgi:hypothetical protein